VKLSGEDQSHYSNNWVPTGLPKQNSLTFPDFSSQSHISLTYIGTNFSIETP